MKLTIKILSQNPNLLSEFCDFGEKCRANETKIGVMPAARVQALVSFGLTQNCEYWIVYDDEGKIVTRLGAHVSPHRPGEGTIGFFEANLTHLSCKEAVALAISTAESWLQLQNVKKIQAPVDINTWFQYRFSKPSKKGPRFKFEPTTPLEYEQLFRNLGYTDHSYYHSIAFPYIKILFFYLGLRGFEKTYKHFLKTGFTHRPMNFEKFEEIELPFIYDLVIKEFSDTVLFEPITFDVFKMLYASALKTYDFSPSCILIDPNQKPAGFLFAFYDNQHLVIKSIAIKKEYQGLKLASGLIFQAVKKSMAIPGMKACVSALVRSGIQSEKIENNRTKNIGLAWKHEYILLKKEL
ncbi:MAG: GNAT family N-acetyltransferase [Bacteriovoracaceae bacterium]